SVSSCWKSMGRDESRTSDNRRQPRPPGPAAPAGPSSTRHSSYVSDVDLRIDETVRDEVFRLEVRLHRLDVALLEHRHEPVDDVLHAAEVEIAERAVRA